MKTCDRHDDMIIVYDVRDCPVCDLEDSLRDEQKTSDRMGREINDLCDKIFELEAKLEERGKED